MDASQPLLELIFLALDHGVASVEKGGPLIPFVMAENDGQRRLLRFVADTLEASVERARAAAAALTESRCALAYEAYLTLEGKRQDAILVEAHERGSGVGVLFAQRFRPAADGADAEPFGNPIYLGEREPIRPAGS